MTKGYIYIEESNGFVNVEKLGNDHRYTYLDKTVGAGGLASDIVDLYKWHKVLNGSTFLSNADKRLIYNNHRLVDSSYTSYGYGSFIIESKVTGKRISHSGDWAGYKNMFDRHIDNNKVIILLQNMKSPHSQLPMNSIYQILYTSDNQTSDQLVEYAGSYIVDNDADDIKTFVVKDEKLLLNVNDRYFLPMIPVGKDNFLVQDFNPEITIQFIRDKNNLVYKHIAYQYDKAHHAIKVKEMQ